MRKFQQEQLLEIVASLHDLHREIENRLEKKEYQTVRTALADCQEAAIQMGEAIELLEGDGTEAVRFLELYCEELYRGSMEIEHISPQKMYKNLEEMMIKVENSIAHITVKKEIVFLPYKASMWDSLESVYLAAKEDESCEAYVVPIPYYDRKADGSLGAVHYEGEEYPSNIEIIPYEEYNLEERKPDTIYIHNPYDNWNTVTCVPERFFASNLKKYTNELVYIPYFVLDEIEPDNQVKIDGMKHFCFLPGVIYADKVIVQSENMRQIYINEYINAAKANGLSGIHTDRKYLEEKILGLGSPKFDKVLNTRKEEIDIPETWLKIMKKPDGSFKKVVLYNTSIGALLQYDEKMLEKMKDVFRIFKEQKEEIALLWRPHPLIQTTIEAMRPKLWEEYSKIVEDYCSQGWGIYDDSADLDRAIVLSDAYYGDQSSVVQLYQKTGKPVMIQKMKCIKDSVERTWMRLLFDGGVCFENKIWCTHSKENAIYSIDVNSADISYEENLADRTTVQRGYFGMQKVEDTLYFSPGMSAYIGSYCIHKKEKKYFPCGKDTSPGYYEPIIRYSNSLYMFPVRERDIMKLDIQTKMISHIKLPEIETCKEHIFNQKGYFTKRYIMTQDKIIIPCAYEDKICLFDLKKEQYLWKNVDIREGFLDIVLVGENIYLLSQSMGIYKTDISLTKKLDKVVQLKKTYLFMLSIQDKLMLIPAGSNDFIMLDTKGNITKSIKFPEDCYFDEELNGKLNNYTKVVEDGKKAYLIPRISNMLCTVNMDSGEVFFKKWKLTEQAKLHVRDVAKANMEKRIILDEEEISLETYVSYVTEN